MFHRQHRRNITERAVAATFTMHQACFFPFILACGVAVAAPPLTPEQRALIHAAPREVVVPGGQSRIRFEGTDYHGYYKCPYVQVLVNGQGPFTFVFDTGASYTSLTTKVIDAAQVPLELDRGGYHDLVRVKSMTIGDVTLRDFVAVRDNDFDVDGVLGFRTFGDRNITFDLQQRELTVSVEPFALPSAFEVPYDFSGFNVPLIPVLVGDTKVTMLIDTGDDAYAFEMRSADLKGAKFEHAPVAAGTAQNGAQSQPTSVTTLASTVQFGPFTYRRPVVAINDDLPVSDFGYEFLRHFRFEFVPARGVVVFQPLFSGPPPPIRGERSPGFSVRLDSGEVKHVFAKSKAGRRGMQAGDKIASVDGHPIASFTHRTWDELIAGRNSIVVRWVHAGHAHTDSLPVAEVH
ncbi:MAG TPA: aspartyl protease family protein [Thermoanaerobaculia bacterium]